MVWGQHGNVGRLEQHKCAQDSSQAKVCEEPKLLKLFLWLLVVICIWIYVYEEQMKSLLKPVVVTMDPRARVKRPLYSLLR